MKNNIDKMWRYVDFGEIIDIFDNIRIPLNSRQRADRQGEYPYYGASGIIDFIDGYLFDGKYILVAEDGENLNSRKLPVAFLATGKFWVNNHAHIIRGKTGIADDRFITAWFAQAEIKGYITGAAQPKLSQENLKRINLKLPPLQTQRKIASILSAYDDLIENNTRRIAILEEMSQRLYKEWFVNFKFPGHETAKFVDSPLGMIPEGWEIKELSEIGFVGRGKSRHRPRNDASLYGGLYPFIQTGDIKEADTYLWLFNQTYNEKGLSQSKLWNAGTLCITIAANIAETTILARKACFPDSVVGFISDHTKSDEVYVKYFLDSIKLNMQGVARGTTQDNLSVEKLLRFKILSPPLNQIKLFRSIVYFTRPTIRPL